MEFAQYNAAQARNEVNFAVQFTLLMRPYQSDELQPWQWYSILAAYYRFVEQHRTESARLARQFYDAERNRVLTATLARRQSVFEVGRAGDTRVLDLDDLKPIEQVERHDFYLNPYTPDIFRENMEPSRVEFSQPDAPDPALQRVVNRAVKEVANGGRRTLIGAVKTDPKVIGWARVEGGGESCGFCAMLISRGPVTYRSFRTAGSMASDELEAIRVWEQFEGTGDDTEIMELMNQWHPNCDCKVVPVFDEDNWPGRERYLELEKLWEDVTRGKSSGRRRRTKDGRSTPSGGDKLIAFRRALGDGYK